MLNRDALTKLDDETLELIGATFELRLRSSSCDLDAHEVIPASALLQGVRDEQQYRDRADIDNQGSMEKEIERRFGDFARSCFFDAIVSYTKYRLSLESLNRETGKDRDYRTIVKGLSAI
jgi:hypothetical protein